MSTRPSFAHYQQVIAQLSTIDRGSLLCDTFELYRDDDLAIFYAPFDYVNREARVVIVGVTPGWTQMRLAYQAARAALRDGLSSSDVLSRTKKAASFGGTMRQNLVAMLDSVGLTKALNIQSSASMFDEDAHLLHSTSMIRFPVFVAGQNYRGSQPSPTGHQVLASYVDGDLHDELTSLNGALIIPLGKSVEHGLTWLADRGRLPREQCMFGFPHPSGANGHRVSQFEQNRDSLSQTVQQWASTDRSR